MPIRTQDIKLLKSSVMADTANGGGQMTGTQVIDGLSNNLFPNTSSADRAFGRVAARKVFGVAQTTDTDTFMGAHAIITSAPADPLVHCALIKTSGWADERTAAKDAIERYVVKGPKASVRIYDTHYAGSMQLRLISFSSAPTFPAGGDAIVIRQPNGSEQCVRVLRTATAIQQVAVNEANSVQVFSATVCTCELGQALSMDVSGPPAARVFNANGIGPETDYAMLYTTSLAAGARFYGIKPLGAAGAVGDVSVTTAGGIYTPVVPAATVETPIIDQYPLQGRSAVIPSAIASVTLPAVSKEISPGAVVLLPTAIEPKSLSMTHGSTAFTDTGVALYQGATKVADIVYSTGRITFVSDCPVYGTANLAIAYKPASQVPAMTHSRAFAITSANQGLSFVDVIEPLPAPGSVTISYMAQERWYEISDNANGKLDSVGYGSGPINYATGSWAVTLAAIPDVGSQVLVQWGDKQSAQTPATLPPKVGADLVLPYNTLAGGITLSWSKDTTHYTATTDATGALSGDATGQFAYGNLQFYPSVFPDGNITANYAVAANTGYTVTGSNHAYHLTAGLPIKPGSVDCTIGVSFPSGAMYAVTTMPVIDINGTLYAYYGPHSADNRYPVGSINYATGDVAFSTGVSINGTVSTLMTAHPATGPQYDYLRTEARVLDVAIGDASGFSYTYGADTPTSLVIASPTWALTVPTAGKSLVQKSVAFMLGGEVYTSTGAVLQKGWDAATGAPGVANAGSVAANGKISITALPASLANGVTWVNAALDSASHLIQSGVFRTASAPLKTGVFQLQQDSLVGSGNDAGTISGGFSGSVDYVRGLVVWAASTNSINPDSLSYNAVFLQYLPLDASLLGLDTARLPLDGNVPIYRSGELVVVHNTQSYNLPNPLVKDTVYNLGRVRLASVRVKDATGVTVPDTLYTAALDPGTWLVPAASDITAYPQPWTVEHRIEDMLLCTVVDISGKLTFASRLTHVYPAGTSFVSSVLFFGDLAARVYNVFDQATWTNVWSDALIGSGTIAQINTTQYPITVTNGGAIKERWLILFTATTAFRVIGETVGEIATGSTALDCSPLNPATGAPYFTIPALAWGAGWSAGYCLRYETDTCGSPFWVIRTVLQGPASVESDQFTLAFRGDVNPP